MGLPKSKGGPKDIYFRGGGATLGCLKSAGALKDTIYIGRWIDK